jgi:hypothetical protein
MTEGRAESLKQESFFLEYYKSKKKERVKRKLLRAEK